jgi:acyl carrier protein
MSRQRGLAGVSVAWGMWAEEGGMAGQLSEGDQARVARMGVLGLSSEQGLELLDAARVGDEALVIAARLDMATLRRQARAGTMPAMLSGLVRQPLRGSSREVGASLTRRLSVVSERERERIVMELVRAETAAVLGHSSPVVIHERRAFKDLGFDSLAAVELRNRLSDATGLHLPSTLIFDFPTPGALVLHVLEELPAGGGTVAASVDAELERLEQVLTSIPVDSSERTKVVKRLQTLAARLEQVEQGPPTASLAEELESASADEVFAFIDEALGV